MAEQRSDGGNQGGYQQDILHRIVNINWGGLAVIFGEKDLPPDEPDEETN